MPRLSNRVAVVTGSSSGIGQAIAVKLAEDGANVVIDYAQDLQGANETLKLIEAAGAKGFVVQADVAKLADASMLIDRALDTFGGVDILVNNAGMERKAAFCDVTEEDYDRTLAVNLKGAFFLAQAFVRKRMEKPKGGRIINISSVHEDMAFPGFTPYCVSKGGMRMLMRNLAVELGPLGITVNNVAPGAIGTQMNRSLLEDRPKLNALLANVPLGRLGTTDDVAAAVAFLASDDGAYINGATILVDGGLSRNYHEQ
jgi:glucose 1-dehydrogenase